MSRVILDLRRITGAITSDTPLFVTMYLGSFLKLPYKNIQYQADYHYTEIIKHIDISLWPEINKPTVESDDNDLKRLIKFVSPFSSSTEWFNDSVVEAFEHLTSYEIDKPLPQITNETLIFGSKTHINPNKINEIIVFRIVKTLGYIYDRYTTFEECCVFVEQYYQSNISTLKNSLLYTIQGMDPVVVLKVYNFVNNLSSFPQQCTFEERDETFQVLNASPKPKFQIDQTKLLFTVGELTDRKKLLTKITASTAYEAIIVCAVKYDIDVSSSSQPLREFEALKKKTYIPYCTEFARKLSINRKFYTVSKTWSPHLLNSHVYTDDQLRNFALDEGYSKVENLGQRELVSFLKATKKMTNFTPGINPNCDSNLTVMLTHIDSLNKDEILCIGIEDEETKQRLYSEIKDDKMRKLYRQLDKHKLQYIQIDELIDFWRIEKVFISPFSNDKIDPIVIEKLKKYCNRLITDKSPCSRSARLLLSTIEDLHNISSLLDIKLTSLKSKIKNLSDIDVKENVEFFFNKCLEFSLYLRGWKVNSDRYPLSGGKMSYDPSMIMARNRIPNKEMYEGIDYTAHQFVMDNSYIALEEALNILKEIPEDLAMDIRELGILKFDNNRNKKEIMGMIFSDVHVNHKETLIDCMQNIFKGMSNIESCMNTNSNWIMFSSTWYMIVLGYSVPFSISDIEAIR